MHLEYQKLMGDYPDLQPALLFCRGELLAERSTRRRERRLFLLLLIAGTHEGSACGRRKLSENQMDGGMQDTRAGPLQSSDERGFSRAYGDC